MNPSTSPRTPAAKHCRHHPRRHLTFIGTSFLTETAIELRYGCRIRDRRLVVGQQHWPTDTYPSGNR
jgi:hypothetical protein